MIIAFEGVDNCGKSSHANKLKESLISIGYPTTIIKFPSKELGNSIRKGVIPRPSAFIKEFLALVPPKQGEILILDRYIMSNIVYSLVDYLLLLDKDLADLALSIKALSFEKPSYLTTTVVGYTASLFALEHIFLGAVQPNITFLISPENLNMLPIKISKDIYEKDNIFQEQVNRAYNFVSELGLYNTSKVEYLADDFEKMSTYILNRTLEILK